MASILRVNTLTDASSNNSVSLETVSNGSAKAWAKLNDAGTAQDSFNISSTTETSTALYTITINNDMNNANCTERYKCIKSWGY